MYSFTYNRFFLLRWVCNYHSVFELYFCFFLTNLSFFPAAFCQTQAPLAKCNFLMQNFQFIRALRHSVWLEELEVMHWIWKLFQTFRGNLHCTYTSVLHSSVLTHLCLLKCFSEMLHNLRHTFGIQKSHTEAVFFISWCDVISMYKKVFRIPKLCPIFSNLPEHFANHKNLSFQKSAYVICMYQEIGTTGRGNERGNHFSLFFSRKITEIFVTKSYILYYHWILKIDKTSILVLGQDIFWLELYYYYSKQYRE